MLLGRFYSQISGKGRVALPAKFKREIGVKIIIARWYEECLVIVGAAAWHILLNRLAVGGGAVTAPVRSVERFILSTAFEIETDAQGRFVIPPQLRKIASLEDEVVFLGLGERVELWNTKVWEKEEEKVKTEADMMLEKAAKK